LPAGPGGAILCLSLPFSPPSPRVNPQLLRSLADRYTIERELGRGGMATVYLAVDTRHHRRVAVKVLHPELSAVIGSERFLKEIEVTAGLQHPHILPLFDSGDVDGQLYYVMPFVEGETLRARLEREKQLPLDDAVRIATEVASALEYAHKRHVVHRDVKPENILLHDGAALVADFGIALAVQDAGGERITQTGLSLGTPQYMAPEQAMSEKSVGPRADIYALGAVTYEMLVGEPPFTGPTAQSIVAKMMTDDPAPPSRLRRSIPPALEAAVLRALEKLPADRWPTAQAFATALSATHAAAPRAPGARNRRATWLPWGVALIAAALAAWGWLRPAPEPPSMPPSRLSIGGVGTGGVGSGRLLTISPDGERVVYYTTANGQSSSSVFELARGSSVPLPSIQGGIDLHIGADGRTVYFGDLQRRQLQRTTIEGGIAVPVREVPSSPFIVNAPDGSLWISTTAFELFRVGPDGRAERRLADVRPALTVAIMQVLDDGRSALAKDYRTSDGRLFVLDLERGGLTPLLEFPVVEARYAVGHLLFVRADGSLHAVRFDPDAKKTIGAPVQLGENVSLTGSGVAQFAVAANGTTVYVPAQPRRLMLVDRTGKAVPISKEQPNFHMPRVSPDGSTIALDFPTIDGRDIWTLDRATGALSRVTAEHDAHDPEWTPDGKEILFSSTRRAGTFGIYRTRPGSGVTTLVVKDPRLSFTGTFLRDGKTLLSLAVDLRPQSKGDVVLVDSMGTVSPLLAEPYDEGWAVVSPDGRWLAYTSTLTGQFEVYVRSLVGDANQVKVSATGGQEPRWSPTGDEIFYRAESDGSVEFVAATIDRGPPLRVTSRKTLFPADEYDAAQPHANYDVMPDGKAFLMIHRLPAGRLTVIQNLPELVRRLSGETKP
jgi:serine/threonine protein kinase